MLPTKFRFIWSSGFRGEDLKKSANQKHVIDMPLRSIYCCRKLEYSEKTWTCRKSLTNFITLSCMKHNSSHVGIKLTILVVIGNDYIGRCKSNYHIVRVMTISSYLKQYQQVIHPPFY
jgi:hypothetical protein